MTMKQIYRRKCRELVAKEGLPVKYPSLPRELNRNYKLSDEDVQNLRREFEEKISGCVSKSEAAKARKFGTILPTKHSLLLELAEKYGVSYTTAYHWTHDEYRSDHNEKSKNLSRKRYYADSKYRHRKMDQKASSRRYAWNVHLPSRIWAAIISARNVKPPRTSVYGKQLS